MAKGLYSMIMLYPKLNNWLIDTSIDNQGAYPTLVRMIIKIKLKNIFQLY